MQQDAKDVAEAINETPNKWREIASSFAQGVGLDERPASDGDLAFFRADGARIRVCLFEGSYGYEIADGKKNALGFSRPVMCDARGLIEQINMFAHGMN